MTLVELIMAMLLLSAIIMAALSMELGLRRLYVSTDMEAQLLSEATPIVAMIAKDINRGIGDVFNAPYNNSMFFAWGTNWNFRIRLDSNNNAQADSSDRWVGYRFRGTTGGSAYQLWRYPNASAFSFVNLTNRTVSISISAPANGASTIVLQLRKDPSQPVGYQNPEVIVNSSAQWRGYSLM